MVRSRPSVTSDLPGRTHNFRGFRTLNLFSEETTVDLGDMFSGGSDILLHEAAGAFVSVKRAEVGEFTICRVRSTGHDVHVREPNALTLIVPLSGQITIEDDFGICTARPGGALLAPPGRRDTRVEANPGNPFVGVPVLIPAAMLGNKTRFAGFRRTISINGSRLLLHAEAIRLVSLLQEELSNGTGLLRRPRAERSWSDLLEEIIGEIIEKSGDLPRCHDVAGSVSARRVRRAEEYMLAHLSDLATIADVAAELGISVRTLELDYRSVHNMSPHSYLARLRLAVARRLLLSDPEIGSVTDVCMACGIGHAGRFSSAYREQYGELPSETLRRR